jgi:urease accessory protein
MNSLALARLLRLASPALPVGAFSYSQALEWAVEAGVCCDERSSEAWISSLLRNGFARFELPMLLALMAAWRRNDGGRARELTAEYLASRETAELRAETRQMGVALRAALAAGGDLDCTELETSTDMAFPTAFAYAATHWGIEPNAAAVGYAFAWVENQVTGAIKLVPLGQSAGQRMLARLSPMVTDAVETATRINPAETSNFALLYAIASCKHETQYTRLFRS